MVKVLTEDEVLQLVRKYAGTPSGDAVTSLADSHETLRYELERLGTLVDVAARALTGARRTP